MLNLLLSLPTLYAACLFVAVAVFGGLAIYLLSHKIIAPRKPPGIRQPTREIIRVAGMLLSLFLSLTFADVLLELNKIQSSIEGEVTVISDIYNDLNRYGTDESGPILDQLEGYVRSVVVDEWPALARDALSDETGRRFRELETAVVLLAPGNQLQSELRTRLLSDLDDLSEYRLTRVQQAMAAPPFFMITVVMGFIVLMICLGIYEPSRVLLVFLGLLNAFVGLVAYLIMAFSDPFQGATGVPPDVFELLLEYMDKLRGA